MESQIKCVLLYPPQWLPFNPHLAPATIQSILRNNGYEVYLRDLNIETDPLHIALWGIPTAVAAFLIHSARLVRFDSYLRAEQQRVSKV